jgi:N-acetyl-1-D-myo-inositol-2-amino-2-deoxy-alpha-D-glucopyranoside deacetylase
LAKTLLAVLAHPDDESFGLGGTLALYARRGVDVYLVCATRGEVGDMDPKYMEGFNTIAERREHELRCAAGHLGLKDVFFLGYRDSGMPGTPDNLHPQSLFSQPLEKVAADVVHYIRLVKPQVVVTFDPIGGYRHPDHIAIHNATVLAFEKADDPTFASDDLPPFQPSKLYFQTFPRGILRFGVRLMRLFGKDPTKMGNNGDVDLESIAAVHFPTNARIDFRPVAEIRDEAAACHASQGGGSTIMGNALNLLRRVVASYETYMRAYPKPEAGAKLEKDLFEGI